jgi:hypothetical protein
MRAWRFVVASAREMHLARPWSASQDKANPEIDGSIADNCRGGTLAIYMNIR